MNWQNQCRIFYYLYKVIRRRIISFLLLCLLLLINWHNTFIHSHYGIEEKDFAFVHQHDHGHHHSDDHHNGQGGSAFENWIKQMLGDFEHPDLGEKHLESFLNPDNQVGLDQPSALVFQPFILTSRFLQLPGLDTFQESQIPPWVLYFPDPSFFDANSNRGPPQFS